MKKIKPRHSRMLLAEKMKKIKPRHSRMLLAEKWCMEVPLAKRKMQTQ
ncbi:MAG: hypothetical protein ACI909_002981 [Planctomycetota bacterium]|jgi:hypothetical protein